LWLHLISIYFYLNKWGAKKFLPFATLFIPFLRYFMTFKVKNLFTNTSKYWKVICFLYQKKIVYKMVYFLLFCVIAMWQLTWPDHFSDFDTFFCLWLFFNASHSSFNLKIYWNIFWKALDLGYLVKTILAEKSRIFHGQFQIKKNLFNLTCQIYNLKFVTKNEKPTYVLGIIIVHKT